MIAEIKLVLYLSDYNLTLMCFRGNEGQVVVVVICNINLQLLKNHQHKSYIRANERNVLNIVSFLIFLWLLYLHQGKESNNDIII